jgi:hypothetical protein
MEVVPRTASVYALRLALVPDCHAQHFFKLSALNAQKKAAIPHGYVTGWWRCQSRRRAPTALNGMMRFL